MDRVGPILSSLGTLLVAVGTLLVLLRTGGLIDALSEVLGAKPKDLTDETSN